MSEKGKRWERGLCIPEYKGLPLDREETDMAQRQMAVYKMKKEILCNDEVLILIWHVN